MAASVVTVLLWCLGPFSTGVDAEVVSRSQAVTLTLNVPRDELEVDVRFHLMTDAELQRYEVIVGRNLPETSRISSMSSDLGHAEIHSFYPLVNGTLDEVMGAEMEERWAAVLQFQPAMPAGAVNVTLSYTIRGVSCIISPRPGGGQFLNMPWLEDDAIPHSSLSRRPLQASSYRLNTRSNTGLSSPRGVCFAGRCVDDRTPLECPGPCSSTDEFEVSWSDVLTMQKCIVNSDMRSGIQNVPASRLRFLNSRRLDSTMDVHAPKYYTGGDGIWILFGIVLVFGGACGSIFILSSCLGEPGKPQPLPWCLFYWFVLLADRGY